MARKIRRQPHRKTQHPEKFVRLRGLSCFQEVHRRVVQGIPLTNVAKFIQDESNEYTDIQQGSLVAQLSEYRQSLTPGEMLAPQMPQHLASKIEEMEDGLNELEGLEELYKIQLERVKMEINTEKGLKKLFRGTGGEIRIASQILVSRANLKMELGTLKRAPMEHHHTLDARQVDDGMRHILDARPESDGLASVAEDPIRRQKVIRAARLLLRDTPDQSETIIDMPAVTIETD